MDCTTQTTAEVTAVRPPTRVDPTETRRAHAIQLPSGQVTELCALDATTVSDRWPHTTFGFTEDEWSDATGGAFPEVELPGGEQTISDTAEKLGVLLAVNHTHFLRGGVVTRVIADDNLQAVRPAELASDLELVARLIRTTETQNGRIQRPTTCSESIAKLILSSQAFKVALPPLNLMSHCPVLIERDGRLIVIDGYDQQSGIFARGPAPLDMPLEEARKILHEVLAGFRFASPADRSRALAATITPSLMMGELLPGRAPIDLGEADQSQSGKGYRNKLTAAIYQMVPATISQRRSGVGGLEESFDRALIAGDTFISLDNVRGKVDSPAIESFMTEDTYIARCAYTPNTAIDPRRVIVMFTSNRANMTDDLANRASCVRLLKQPEGYRYQSFPEGDLLAHVRTNQPRYLGAVFAVVREWYARGKPRTGDTRHDFRDWAQVLDWVVQHLLVAAPLLDGHRETQGRMTNPAMNWLRDVALAVVGQSRQSEWLMAGDLLEVIYADGAVEIPGLKENTDLECESVREGVLKQIGRRLKRAFGTDNEVTIDRFVIERDSYPDDRGRERHRYLVRLTGNDLVPPDAPDRQADLGAGATGEESVDGASQARAPRCPPDAPIDETRDSIDAPDVSESRVKELSEPVIMDVTEPSVGSMASGGEGPSACDRCGSTEYRDVPIHDGRSLRRDCGHCGRFLGWQRWCGRASTKSANMRTSE